METIIIWIVIVAVGAAYEWVKKKAAPSEDEQRPPARTSRPAPCDAPWSTDRAMQQPARMQHSGGSSDLKGVTTGAGRTTGSL